MKIVYECRITLCWIPPRNQSKFLQCHIKSPNRLTKYNTLDQQNINTASTLLKVLRNSLIVFVIPAFQIEIDHVEAIDAFMSTIDTN